MRKILLACLIFVLLVAQKILSSPRLDSVEIKFSSALTIPAPSSEKEKSLSAGGGIKLCASDLFFVNRLDARGYFALPKTPFSGLVDMGGIDGKKVRYGLGVSLFEPTIPVQVKAGHISYSKSISKLRNPAPSAVANPLKKSFAFSTGVGASLPTLSSSVQPLSVALCLSLPKGRFALPLRAESFFTEERNFAVSVGGAHSFGSFLSIRTALTGARFFVENTSSLLKKTGAECDGSFLCAFLWEANVSTPIFKTNLAVALHQSPYERVGAWLKVDGRAAYKSVLLDFSFFALPTAENFPDVAPLIGIDSAVVRTLQSALLNPQFVLFLPGKSAATLRCGLSVHESVRVVASKNAEQLLVGKSRAGLEYESPALTVTCDVTAANVLLAGSPPNKSTTPELYYGLSVGANFVCGICRAACSVGLKYVPPFDSSSKDKKSLSFDVSAVPKKWSFVTLQSAFGLVFRDGDRTSSQLDSSVCFRAKTVLFNSAVNSSLKFALSVPF